MSNQQDSENNSSLPAFPVRWLMFFRRYPFYLINFKFLYGVIFKRSPLLWDNFMKGENKRRLKSQGKSAAEQPKTIHPKGLWRDEELPPLGSSRSDCVKYD